MKAQQVKFQNSFLVFPKNANHMTPIIFGGDFMAQLDLCAAQAVRRFLYANNSPCENAVTHKINFTFERPCYVGDTLDLTAEVTGVGTKSVLGRVTAYRTNLSRKENVGADPEKIAVAEFVFITVGDLTDLQSKPRYLPYRAHELVGLEFE